MTTSLSLLWKAGIHLEILQSSYRLEEIKIKVLAYTFQKKLKKLSLHISILVSAEIFAQLNRFLLPQLQKTTEEMFKKLCVENRLQLGQCAWIAEMWNKKKNPEGVFSFETAAPQHF